jgi:hypothetical protein
VRARARVFESKRLFFLDLSMVDRLLHDDPRKIYSHLKAPRFDLHRACVCACVPVCTCVRATTFVLECACVNVQECVHACADVLERACVRAWRARGGGAPTCRGSQTSVL